MNFKEFLTSKKYGSLHYKLSYFFHNRIPFLSPGWNEYHNPWYIWWKCRKHFKKPKWCLVRKGRIAWFFGLPCRRDYYNRIFDIHLSALGWKDKFDSPRHEWDPYIAITFLRKWQLCWWFTYIKKGDKDSKTRNLATWEAMLDYLYYGRSIDYCRNNHIWRSGVGKDCHLIYINDNLK